MKMYILPLFYFFISVMSFGQKKNEQQIRLLLENQVEAWNRGDKEGFMKGYWENDSLMFIGKNGITYGYNQVLANYKKSYPDTAAMGKLTFSGLTLKRLSPRYYFVAGRWHLKRSIGDAGGHFSLLLRKSGKRWLIVADHSS
ncbi:MAG: DUF4440 domain-containing protein [Chitinophagaceae bacterium]|nr:DUF4440 domain-containing protein [Chitinophagaceae bacterium]